MIGMLGKLPPKLDNRTLRLASVTRAAPLSAWWFDKAYPKLAPHPVPMLANDTAGDCALVAACHHQLGSEAIEHGAWPAVTDDAVLTEYYRMTGGGDDGLYMLDVLNAWRRYGMPFAAKRERITAFGSVDPRDDDAMRRVCVACRGLYLGLSLPLTARDQLDAAEASGKQCVWTLVNRGRGDNAQPGSWGGHAVAVFGYSWPYCWWIPTWGTVVKASPAFVRYYADEAYGVVDSLDARLFDVPAVTAYLAALE